MGLPKGLAGERCLVADLHRVVRVEVHDTLVLDKDTGNAVARSRHQIGIIEADILRSRRDKTVPVLLPGLASKSQMPFAYRPGRISALLENIGNRRLLGTDYHRRIARRNARVIPPPGIMTRQQGIARRGTGRRHRVRVGEADTLGRQLIDIRGLKGRRPVTTQVSIANIIGED